MGMLSPTMRSPALLSRLALGAAFALLFLLAPASHVSAASGGILRLKLDDTINPITQEYIERGIAEASRTNASAVLIEINTPGGLLDATRKIVEAMLASPVPVIVYVTPSGSRAASAGLFILEAADVAAMAPGTNTGAAHPVVLGGAKLDDVMKTKMENDAAALMRSVVAKRGRNVELAESGVRESKSFSDQEALQQKLIDVVAKDESALFQQISERDVTRFSGEKSRLPLNGQPVTDFDLSLRERILDKLMDPNLAALLLSLGMLALYAEFNHPGAVIPGVVGGLAVLLALFALNLLPTRFEAIVLVIAAFALFALEAKLGTHGALGIGGVIALVMGVLLLVDGPIPEMRVHWATALSLAIPLGLISVFLMRIAVQARRNKITTGIEGMIGTIGVAASEISLTGKVTVRGELWNAFAASPVPPGANVVVKRVDGLRLEVESVR